MTHTLTIRLDAAMAETLKREARSKNLSQGEIVRAALVQRLNGAPGSALDGLRSYVGIVAGPRDLSTNKRHLAGMGKRRKP
jgi:hypothetical protein